MMISHWNFLIILIFTLSAIKTGKCDEEKAISATQKLHEKLLANYDTKMKPVTHHSNITEVDFNIMPFGVLQLLEDWSLLWMDSWLFLSWVDYRLRWNPEDYDGIQILHLPYYLIWHPDVVVFNWHSGWIDPKVGTPIVVVHTGRVTFVPPAILVTRCPINLIGLYPNDKITCEIIFGSYGIDGFKTDLKIPYDGALLNQFSNTNPRWEVLTDEIKLTRSVKHYNCCEDPHITVVLNVPMKRRPPSELQVVQTPCILLMSLTLMMFLIPSNPDKKVILGGFIISILCLLIAYVAFFTTSPTSVLKAVTFLKTTLCVVSVATMLEFMIISLPTIVDSSHPPAALIRTLTSPFIKYFAIWPPWEIVHPGDKMRLREDDDEIFHTPSAEEEWTLVITCLDRLAFIIFIIVLPVAYHI